ATSISTLFPYTTLFRSLHYLEHLVPVWWRTGDLVTANRHLATEVVWPHFWAIQLWLIILLFVYRSLRELVRANGREKVVDLFFRSEEHTSELQSRFDLV